MVAQTLDYYIDLVCQMKRGNYRGHVYNAKPIFLLFILEQIDKKEIKYNRISFQRCLFDNSYENFSNQYTLSQHHFSTRSIISKTSLFGTLYGRMEKKQKQTHHQQSLFEIVLTAPT